MNKKQKLLSLILCATLILTLAVGCSGTQAPSSSTPEQTPSPASEAVTEPETAPTPALEPVTYTMYTYNGDDANREKNEYAIEVIKKEFPEVTIEIENLESSDPTWTKMKTYITSKEVPDFFMVQPGYADALITSGQVADLTGVAQTCGLLDSLYPPSLKIATYDGKILTAPGLAMSFCQIYYNKEIFAANGIEIPKTYDEFLAVVKQLRAAGIDPIGLMGKDKWPYAMLLDIFATRYDNMASENVLAGTAKFTDEAYMKAAQKINDLALAGAFSKDANIKDYSAALEDFTSGKAAMFVNGSWSFTEIGDQMGYDKFGYLYFPVDDIAQYEESKLHWAGGDGSPVGWGMNPNSFKTAEEFERGARILTLWAKSHCEMFAKLGNPVVSMKVDVTPDAPYPEVILQWQKDYGAMLTSPVYMQWNCPTKASTEFADGVQKLATGEYDSAQFCADMQKAFDDAA